jgi:IS66 C-terminal element
LAGNAAIALTLLKPRREQIDPFYGSRNREAAIVDRNMGANDSARQLLARHGQNVRLMTIVRKNSLFAGSAGGGRTWATIATLIQTAKMNSVDPLASLTQTLERIAAGWPASDIEALMPWNFQK